MKVTLMSFVSLDGVVQAPGGPDEDTEGGFAHGGWSMPFFDPATMGPAWDDALAEADAMLFGRRTWEVSGPAWTSRAGDPFADRMNAIPKYVASRTVTDPSAWSSSTILPARRCPRRDRRAAGAGRVAACSSWAARAWPRSSSTPTSSTSTA